MAPRKPGASKAETAPRRIRTRAKPPALPAADGDAPLQELARDPLSVLLYMALTPEETKTLVKSLQISVPGFRAGALSDVERCDVLADEIRAAPDVRAPVLEAMRKAFGRLPLDRLPVDRAAADDLLAVAGSEHALTLSLWRVLADPDPAVRARAVPVLEQLAGELYAPAELGVEPAERPEEPGGPDGEARALARVGELEQELARAEERAAGGRRKAEEQREKLQEWLKEARARAAQAVDEAARAREAAEVAQRARERAEVALAAAQSTDAAADAQRARAAHRELAGKAAALEVRLTRQEEREVELAAALREAEARAGRVPERAPIAVEASPEEPEDAPASWLMPVYTREFYDSLDGWDRRIQRAAFKQANLLAQDHRHPSLRALPLEGLPGYYRVRVATDVRLLYRRGEPQNAIEILSLIDREDLDRYVRQAKTRQ